MAENPIIVFFYQRETTILLPIAFSSNSGSFNPIQKADEALLVVLNDEQMEVPELMHTNQDQQAPLGVISHNETAAKMKALERYGQPIYLEGFSRVHNNEIFNSIKRVLSNNSDVARFVDKWSKNIAQADLNELAALIPYLALRQHNMPNNDDELDEAERVFARYEALLGRCKPTCIEKSIGNLVSTGEFVKALCELETIAGQQA